MRKDPLIVICSLILMTASLFSYADSEISDKETGCKIWNSKSLEGYAISWTGQCKNGKADGIGSLQWFYNKSPKGRYDGDYVLGKMHGHGTYAMDDGSRYIGEFRNNLRSGRGAYLWADGTRYEGDYQNNLMDGKGTIYWVDGSFYVGEFQQDRKFGYGKLSLVLNNPHIKVFADSGKWVGNYYVVEGVFADDNLIASCPSEAACVKQLTQAMQVKGRKNAKETN
ncbi:MAG: hypothetical protein V4440_10535 [Pseudomonadota bacterium]